MAAPDTRAFVLAPSPCPPILLRLSDQPQVERAGHAPLPLAPRDAALLAWLALEGPTSRDRLGALLWPDSTTAQARTTLRQRLFQLKRLLGQDVATGSPTLALAPGFEHDLSDATELLGDIALPDAPELDAWLRRQRDQRRGQEHDSLRAQVDALEAAGDADAALQVAQALLRLQPLSERAHQRVMRLHYLLGDRAAALAAFDACEQVLKHELSARPSVDTLALLATIEKTSPPSERGVMRSLPAAVQRPPALVGRDAELQQLARAWRRGQVAVVTGEAGLGKSRLLAEFGASRPGTVRASARPGDAGMPFATLVRLLRAVAPHGAADGVDVDMRHALARVMPELAREGDVFADAPREVLLQAVQCWLQAAPSVTGLLLDDLHFADEASLQMLQSLLVETSDLPSGAPPWALAWRCGEADAALQQLQTRLADGARLAHIPLPPLDASALADLVDQLDLGWSGASVAPVLQQHTGGNPLFLLETLKQAWLEPGAAWPKPESVERLLDRRIARLSPAPLALARVAAIAGVDFGIELAAAVLDSAPLQLADAWNELEAAQVLSGPTFTHDLVADAVRRSVPQAVALHVHAQVATWLEVHGGEPARIASHWFAAGQPSRTPRWLGLAARRSMQMLRNAEALAFLEQKAVAEADAGDLAAAFASQCEAVRLSLDVDRDAERGAARCDRLMQWAISPAQRCEARFWRASLAFRRIEADSIERLIAVLQEAQALGETRIEMECHVLLTLEASRLGHHRKGLFHAQACVGWIEAHGGLMRRGELHTYLAQIHGQIGTVEQALNHHHQAIAIARELGVAHHVVSVLDHLATTLWRAGRTAEAMPHIEEALRIVSRHQTAPEESHALMSTLAVGCVRLGRYRRAMQAFGEAQAAHRATSTFSAAVDTVHFGMCLAEMGQWARAHALVESLPTRWGESGAPPSALGLATTVRQALGQPATSALMECWHRLPEDDLVPRGWCLLQLAPQLAPSQALQQLEDLRSSVGPLGFDGHVLASYVRSAQVALAIAPALARDHALRALELAKTRDLTGLYRGELWLHCARALQAAGDTAHAAAVLAEGQAWVRMTAAEHVPDEFRESFLHRNPTNAALLAMVILQPA